MTGREEFYELVQAGKEGNNIGLTIGLPKLETYMDGLLPGTSYLIGAASGVGKTTFMLYAFVYKPLMQFLNGENTNRDPYWIFFNLEMTRSQLYAKLVSMYVYEKFGEQLSFREIFSRGKNTIITDSHYDLLQDKCSKFLDILDERIKCYDGTLNSTIYKNIILKELERFGRFENSEYIPNNPSQIIPIIIDHMSLIRASSGVSKKEEMDRVSSYSVQLRNKCKIVSPIHIMQFNRDAGNSERLKQALQEPTSNDFKDSGAMYEDSQVVLALHSPVKFKLTSYRKYNVKILEQVLVACILLKTRFGTSDIADVLGYYGDCSLYKELPKPEEIFDYEVYKYPDWDLKDNSTSQDNTKMKLTL